jgi:hypothetical protein
MSKEIDIFDIGKMVAKSMETWKSEDDTDTLKVVDRLKQLNKLGFVTTESQTGGIQEGIGVGKFKGKPYYIKQRAYILAITTPKIYEKLKQKISFNTELIMMARPSNKSILIIKERDLLFDKTQKIPVTIQKKNNKFEAITNMISFTEFYSNGWNHLHEMLDKKILSDKNIQKNICENTILVQIFDPVWNRESYLFDSILKVIKSK